MPEHQPHQSLPQSVGVLHEIRWSEVCPWLILVKALRVSLLLRVLALATLGVLITQLGWSLISQSLVPELPPTVMLPRELPALDQTDFGGKASATFHLGKANQGTFIRGWFWLTEPFLKVARNSLTWQASLGICLCGLWSIVVWGLFGGAISRIAALYLTRGEKLGAIAAIKEALSNWNGTVGAPLLALLITAVFALPLIGLGFLLRFDLAAYLAGALWCLVLAWGFVLAWGLLGLLVGWPLMWACLSVERSDAFDALSRCFAYVYQRPLHLFFFLLVTIALCFLGELVVGYFIATSISLADWAVSLGAGSDRARELLTSDLPASSVPVATQAIHVWKWILASVGRSFPLACLWPMSVGIYLLLRRKIDATEMDEIALPSSKATSNVRDKTDSQPSAESNSGSEAPS